MMSSSNALEKTTQLTSGSGEIARTEQATSGTPVVQCYTVTKKTTTTTYGDEEGDEGSLFWEITPKITRYCMAGATHQKSTNNKRRCVSGKPWIKHKNNFHSTAWISANAYLSSCIFLSFFFRFWRNLRGDDDREEVARRYERGRRDQRIRFRHGRWDPPLPRCPRPRHGWRQQRAHRQKVSSVRGERVISFRTQSERMSIPEIPSHQQQSKKC